MNVANSLDAFFAFFVTGSSRGQGKPSVDGLEVRDVEVRGGISQGCRGHRVYRVR